MLTPLPLPTAPTPLPPGSHALPLPQGAETARLPRPAPLPPSTLVPDGAGPGRAGSGGTPLPTLPGAGPTAPPLPSLAGAELRVPLLAGDAMASAAALPESAATPMSLVAAQMLGVDTAPVQALLAQQAATRALPGAARRTETHHDTPPDPTSTAPDDSFDPHAPHPPPLPPHHGPHPGPPPGAKAAPDPLGDAAEPDPPDGKTRARTAAALRRDDPLIVPPPTLLPRGTAPWVLAGAIFVGVFVLAVLSL